MRHNHKKYIGSLYKSVFDFASKLEKPKKHIGHQYPKTALFLPKTENQMLKTENPETATDNKTEKPKLTPKNGKNRKTENPNAPLLYVCIYKVPDDENCERCSKVIMPPQTMKCYH